MPKRELRGSRAIVTGTSSGIGRALALQLAREGVRLVVTARRADRLAELAGAIGNLNGEVQTVVGDVTEPSILQKLVDVASASYGGLDILVNNAGIGAFGRFDNAGPDRLRRVMEVNFFALAELTRLALPQLKQGVRPMIVNISSVLGHRAVPRSSEYCASKFAVQGFSESLRVELAPHGVDVLVVCPGLTQTEFTASSIDQVKKPDWPQHPGVPAEYVARKTVQAMRSGLREIMPFGWGKVLCLMNSIAPSLVDRFLNRYA
jgi:short-subunit dehydrogenase